MPRKYISKANRRYISHDPENLKRAVDAIANNGMSYRQAASTFGIPKTVLVRHKKGGVKKQGGQTVLSTEEENLLIMNLNVCSDWGYPLDTYDLQLLVKNYLDKLGRSVPRFRNNLPGKEFVYGFLKRHKNDISNRMCENIKRSRAQVSRAIVEEYFANLSETLKDIPPTHLINYDETNLADDVGRKKVITKRGCKHPERVMNTSKSATSIMFAITGDGQVLDPYVVYKAQNMYSSWTEGGPRNSRYNRTPSGWFDADCFEDWVLTVVIPYFRKLDGRKVLIGDNLSSHLSLSVVKELKKYNVDMVFLPANSTHLTQPLDVAFFRPFKVMWRKILLDWKKGPGRTEASIPKSVFPRLLKQLMDEVVLNAKPNIISGFRKTGLIPLNKEEVLKQLPKENLDTHEAEAINTSIIDLLKEMRYPAKPQRKSNNKKVNVLPGKSVKCDSSTSDSSLSAYEEDMRENYIDEEIDLVDENLNFTQNEENTNIQSSSSDDDLPLIHCRNGNSNMAKETSNKNIPKELTQNTPSTSRQIVKDAFDIGDWILVKFPVDRPTAVIKSRAYIGRILSKTDSSYIGTFLRRKIIAKESEEVRPLYYYPAIPDESEFSENQILKKLSFFTERRGLFSFKNLDTKDYENL